MTDPRGPRETQAARPCANTARASTDLPHPRRRERTCRCVEPAGFWLPVQPPASKRCPACQQVKPCTDFFIPQEVSPTAGTASGPPRGWRAAPRRSLRLLIAAHPEGGLACSTLIRAIASWATCRRPRVVAAVPRPSARSAR